MTEQPGENGPGDNSPPSLLPSTTCVVVPSGAGPWWLEADLEYARCGKPVVGQRGDWPMCADHFALFDPSGATNDEAMS